MAQRPRADRTPSSPASDGLTVLSARPSNSKPADDGSGVFIPAGLPLIDIAKVIPYARNARTHSDKQVAEIAASIRQFGFRMPIGISFQDGNDSVRLWAGHGRILGAAKLGMLRVPFIDWSDLSENEQRALALVDNKVALNAGWDDNILGLELADLRGLGVDIDSLGFNEAELKNLLAPIDGGNGDADAPVGEPPVNPVTRYGDTWVLGNHLVRCGDSTNAEDVAALLGDEKPFLMVTDPPYGVEYDAGWRNKLVRADGSKVEVVNTGEVKNDEVTDWTPAWKLFPGDVAYVWHSSAYVAETIKSLIAAGFEMRAEIIWNKGRLVPGRGHYHYQHEPCRYVVRVGKNGHWHGDRKQSTIWDIQLNSGFESKKDTGGDAHTKHSTQKPVDCMQRPMLNNSEKGDAVYDPFLGSGTTIIAAERCGRRARGMELNPGYVDIGIMRWEKETGRKATLMGSTKTFDEVRTERLG